VKVLIFGATGMVGQGVLRECLLDGGVDQVRTVGRHATGQQHEKLSEIVHGNLLDLTAFEDDFTGFDACFYCLGVSSAGMSETDYTRVTYDVTMAVARTLVRRNPGMTFVFVSGAGTDGTGQGRSMWARVKGRTESALLALPFRAAWMFRPAFIRPLHGIVSRTPAYRALYAVLGPLTPVLEALAPAWVTTTEKVGKAMLAVVRRGASKTVLENSDINALAG